MTSLPSRAARRVSGSLAILTAAALVVAGLGLISLAPATADSAPADPSDPATPTTVTAYALPTAQINGVAWAQAVVGNVVFVGGDFTKARPAGAAAGTSEVDRSYLLAYDITTGELLPDFAPQLNGQVRALAVSPDKGRLYVGGTFTSVDGQTRNRIAAFDLTTRALDPVFRTNINYDVYAIAPTDQKVFVGGNFQSVGTNARGYLAAFTTNGALLDWAPQANAMVRALALSPDATKIAVGGFFTSLNGSTNPGNSLALVDTTTGAVLPTAINSIVRNGGTDSAITSLISDGDRFYGSAYSLGNRTALEGMFAASFNGGTTTWIADCHGDMYSAYPRQGAVYGTGHSHYCGNIDGFPETTPTSYQRAISFSAAATRRVTRERLGYQNFEGQPAPELLTWFPRLNAGTFTGLKQGPWTVTGNDDYVVMAGEFTLVNNKPQQGLVRFASRALAPKSQGPRIFGADNSLNLVATGSGRVRINWRTNEDLDNESLTYRVYRDVLTRAGLRYEKSRRADYWAPDTMGFTDSGLTPGTTYQYRVSVTDPDGNIAYSPWTSFTAPTTGAGAGTESAYSRAVYDSQPSRYWRFSESSGSTVADASGFDPLTTSGTVTRGVAGAIAGDADRAITFNGSSGYASTRTKIDPTQEFSIEAWFRTDRAGGKIVGFGDRATGSSSAEDRNLYLNSSGRLVFGVNNGSAQVVTSNATYTDNKWHQAVATMSRTEGMKLYVDGSLVAQRADVWFPRTGYAGYWRVGYDNLASWPSRPSSYYFRGSIDDVSIYHRPLTAADVTNHYRAATGANLAPIAAFSTGTADLSATVDASASYDVDGTVADYQWDFGDGSTGSGATASHTYAAAGSYTLTLTVTDNSGATSSTTRTVEVRAANAAPSAAFTSTVAGLQASFDAAGSNDPDGSLVSYDWTFGDGESGTGANPTHTYAADGTYPVRLTVTDDRGATATTTSQVSVAAPVIAPFALDTFNRVVTGGWGIADTGGAWVRTGTATNFAVSGGTGTIKLANAGSGPRVTLSDVASADTEVRVRFTADKTATGNGTYSSVETRTTPSGDAYTTQVRWLSDGRVDVSLIRRVGGATTVLANTVLAGVQPGVGDYLQVRAQAVGTGPTQLRAKVWLAGTAEPDAWTLTAADSTAALQQPGAIALAPYLSGTSTNAPIVVSYADLWAGPTG